MHNRAICYERMGNYNQAIEDFSNVINNNKENANAYFNRGCCYDAYNIYILVLGNWI